MIETIGRHRVKNGDIMYGIGDLMRGEKAQVVYCDPPWGSGHLRYWHTMNGKVNPAAPAQDYKFDDFLATVIRTAAEYAHNVVLIEYGVRWDDQIRKLTAAYGLTRIGRAAPRYQSGAQLLPLHLHILAKRPTALPEGYIDSIGKTFGLETVRRAIQPFIVRDGIVLDPCCGKGNTARIAVEYGMRFYGNELNPKRLKETANFLKRKVTAWPEQKDSQGDPGSLHI